MRTISYKLDDLKKIVIPIGFEGENDHTRVIIDAGEVFAQYPSAAASLRVKPPQGSIYPVVVNRDGDRVIWNVKDTDCASDGSGEAQFTFTENNVIVKSVVTKIKINRSLKATGPAPDPIEDWLDEANEALEEIQAAEVNQPTIGEDGYWYTWDQENGEYEKTNTKAQGVDGHSPVLTSSKDGKTTILYADGEQIAQIQDGEDGQGADVIDDTSGEGDTDKTWSADKLTDEFGDVLNEIHGITPDAQQSDIGKALILKTIDQTGKPTAFEYGEAGGGSVDPSVVEQKVDEWLEENITNPDSPPLDRSLSSSSSAAPADIVGTIKNATFEGGNILDLSAYASKNNSAVTNNGDGTYTFGTKDYGICSWATAIQIPAGNYTLIGIPAAGGAVGFTYISTTGLHKEAIQTNATTSPVSFTNTAERTLYFGVRLNQRPSEAFTITPQFFVPKEKKLNKNLGEVNKGKFLVVGNDGNVETVTVEKEPYVRGELLTNWNELDNITQQYIKTDGTVANSSYRRLSDYIRVLPGDTISYKNLNCLLDVGYIMAIACYDENKNFISDAGVQSNSETTTGTYVLPNTVYYIKISDNSDMYGSFAVYEAVTQAEGIELRRQEIIATKSNLVGMKIAMIGDSTYALTGGGSLSNERVSDYLAKLSNATVSNFAIGGTIMAQYRPLSDSWHYYDFVELMTAKINDDMSDQLDAGNLAGKPAHVGIAVNALNDADLSTYDILLINYGTNDFAGESPLADANNNYNTATFTGAIRTMIEMIATAYPHLHIVFNTPFWRCWPNTAEYVDDAFTHQNVYNLTLVDYIDKINEIANGEYGLPVINNLFEIGWNKFNRYDYFDDNDGTHFNILGAKEVARKTFEFLNRQGFALGELSE